MEIRSQVPFFLSVPPKKTNSGLNFYNLIPEYEKNQ